MFRIRVQNKTLDDTMELQNARMFLYDIHDNVLLYLTEVCLKVAKVLELREHVLYIKSIIQAMNRFKYDLAWSGIVAFSLLPGVLKMYDYLGTSAEPGVAHLAKVADEFNIG